MPFFLSKTPYRFFTGVERAYYFRDKPLEVFDARDVYRLRGRPQEFLELEEGLIQSIKEIDLYVSPDGDDSWPGTEGKPLRTISEAVRRLPRILRKRATIHIAKGIYFETVILANFLIAPEADLILKGELETVSDEFQADIFSAYTIGNSSLSWTEDEHRGKIVELTAGTGAGQRKLVRTNTATTLNIRPNAYRDFSPAPDATTKFVLKEPASIISGAEKDAPTTPTRDVFFIYNCAVGGTLQLQNLSIEYAYFSGLSIYHTLWSIYLDLCRFKNNRYVNLASGERGIVAAYPEGCYLAPVGVPTYRFGHVKAVGYASLTLMNSVIDCESVAYRGGFLAFLGCSIRDRIYNQSTYEGGRFYLRKCEVSNPQGDGVKSDYRGSFRIVDVTIKNCAGSAINLDNAEEATVFYVDGTGNSDWGSCARNGSVVKVNAATGVTGNLGDCTVDGSTAVAYGALPVTNTTELSRIYL